MNGEQSRTGPPDWRRSSLFCIHNGFMLGVFTQLMAFDFAQSRFVVLRDRVTEFLAEAGISTPIASDHEVFVKSHSELFASLKNDTTAASRLLGAYFFVGSACAAIAAGYARGEEERKEVEDAVAHLLEITPIAKNPWPRFVKSVDEDQEGLRNGRAVNVVLSPCLDLVAEVIRQLPDECCRNMCFVAMSFTDPYLGHYSTLFTRLAHELQCVPMRAWGGLSDEIYTSLLYQLVRRADAVVADVSGANINVIYEVGLAHGMGKKVHMVRRSDRPQEVSNLMGILVFEYSPAGEKWVESATSRYFATLALLECAFAYAESDAPSDPEAFLEWRRERGGLEVPAPEPGEPPFITIFPSSEDQENS